MHGTRAAYVADRCRCAQCREANRAQEAARVRAVAYGRWQPFVDAEPARGHLVRLRAAGVGVDAIVVASGVASGVVRALLYGDPRTGRPVARIRPSTQASLLTVPLPPLAATAGRGPYRWPATGWDAGVPGTVSGTADEDDEVDAYAAVLDDGGLVDEVAVERAMAGDRRVAECLTPAEQVEAVRRLSARGMSIRQIGVVLGLSPRTVSRRRAEAG